jgi:hypothetical protein
LLPQLAALLSNHGLHGQFNISLAHRHFLLFDHTEQAVELKSQSGSELSSVFKNGVPDLAIVQKYGLVVPTAPSIIPDTFLIDHGKLLPYEFTCMETREADEFLGWISDINPRFLQDWSRILEENRVRGRFGLALRARGESVKLQLCDPAFRVDRILSGARKSDLPLSPNSVPAE